MTTTKDDHSLCLVLEQAQGIDLITFIKLLDPKLKFDSNSMVYKHSDDLVVFLRHIVIQIAIAFEALHKAGIMYKDLKATHIFIDKSLRVTMIDFGLAEQMSDGSTSTPAGTMHAMSPEMLILWTKVANGQQDKIDYTKECVTCAHDYYSLGVLLLELIDPSLVNYFKTAGANTGSDSYIQRLNAYFNERLENIYTCHSFKNSKLDKDFLAFLEGLLTPDPN